MSVCPCCLSGQRFKKYSTKTANTLISLFAKGAVKLSPLMPRFPSRLIKEEIALEEAMMTKGLLIIERPLYRAHIRHKNPPNVSASSSPSQQKMNSSDWRLYPRGYFSCLWVCGGIVWWITIWIIKKIHLGYWVTCNTRAPRFERAWKLVSKWAEKLKQLM